MSNQKVFKSFKELDTYLKEKEIKERIERDYDGAVEDDTEFEIDTSQETNDEVLLVE